MTVRISSNSLLAILIFLLRYKWYLAVSLFLAQHPASIEMSPTFMISHNSYWLLDRGVKKGLTYILAREVQS
jgi:hypothetical protein